MELTIYQKKSWVGYTVYVLLNLALIYNLMVKISLGEMWGIIIGAAFLIVALLFFWKYFKKENDIWRVDCERFEVTKKFEVAKI